MDINKKLIIITSILYFNDLAARTPAPMPIKCSIEKLSDDEGPPETPKESPCQRPTKRRRVAKNPQPSKQEMMTERFLRSILGRQCPCKRKTCLQQFTEPGLFSRLQDLRQHWYSLHKLDQDSTVTSLRNICFNFLAHVF